MFCPCGHSASMRKKAGSREKPQPRQLQAPEPAPSTFSPFFDGLSALPSAPRQDQSCGTEDVLESHVDSLKESQRKVAELELMIQTLQGGAEAASSKEDALRDELKQLNAALQGVQQQRQTVADDFQQSRQQASAAQADTANVCSVLFERISCLQTALRLQRSRRIQALAQVSALSAELKEAQAGKDAALQEAAKAEAAHSALQEQLQQTEAALAASQASNKAKSQQLSQVTAESKQAAAQLTSLQAARDAAEARCTELQQAELTVCSDLLTVQSDLTEQKQALERSQAEKTIALQQLEQSVTKASQLQADLKSAQSDLSSIQQQLTQKAQALTDSQAEHEQTLERLDGSDDRARQLQVQLDDAQAHFSAVQQQLSQKTQALTDSQAELEQTLERLQVSDSRALQLQADLETVQAADQNASANATELQIILEQTQQRVTELQQSHKSTQQQLETSQAACETLAKANRQFEASTAELTQQLQTNEEKSQTASDLAITKQTLRTDAQAQLESVTASQEANTVQVTELQELLQRAQQANNSLEQQHSAAQRQLADKQTDHQAALDSILGLQTELESTQASARTAAEQADARDREHAAAVATLRRDLAAERKAAKEITRSSQRQQHKDRNSIQQLQAALAKLKESATTKAQDHSAAVTTHAQTLTDLHAKLAAQASAFQAQLQSRQREHDSAMQGLQTDLQTVSDAAKVSEDKASAIVSSKEATIVALETELQRVGEAARVSKDKASAAAKTHAAAIAGLQTDLQRVRVSEDHAAANAKSQQAVIAGLQTDLERVRVSEDKACAASKTQQATIAGLHTQVQTVREAARVSEDKARAAAKSQQAIIEGLQTDLQTVRVSQDHAVANAKSQQAVIAELQTDLQRVRVSEDKANAAVKGQEMAIAVLHREMSQLQQQLASAQAKLRMDAADAPPGFSGRVHDPFKPQQGSLRVLTGAVQQAKPSSQDPIVHARQGFANDVAQPGQEAYSSSSLSSVASSSSFGPVTPQDAPTNPFSTGRLNAQPNPPSMGQPNPPNMRRPICPYNPPSMICPNPPYNPPNIAPSSGQAPRSQGPATAQLQPTTGPSRVRPNPPYNPPGASPPLASQFPHELATSTLSSGAASGSSVGALPPSSAVSIASASGRLVQKYDPPSHPTAQSQGLGSRTGQVASTSSSSAWGAQPGPSSQTVTYDNALFSRDAVQGSGQSVAAQQAQRAQSAAHGSGQHAVAQQPQRAQHAQQARQPVAQGSGQHGAAQQANRAQPARQFAAPGSGQHAAAQQPQRAQRAQQARQSVNQGSGQHGAAQQAQHAQQARKSLAQGSGQHGATHQPQRAQHARQAWQAGVSGLGPLSDAEQILLQTDHEKPLVGCVVRVDERTHDDTHVVFCDMARQVGWGYYQDVRGDGNCGYRAFGLALVVAMSGLDADVRASFTQHLKGLNKGMQRQQPQLMGNSPSGGTVKEGFDALLNALRSEPSRRQLIDGRTCVASEDLVRSWNRSKTSDAVVNFLRALAAFHMLQHPQFYTGRFQFMFDHQPPHSLRDLCLEYVSPFCESANAPQAVLRGADIENTLYALAQALGVTLHVQTRYMDCHTIPTPEDTHGKFAWQAELRLINKPGHFAVAWM